MNVFPESHVCPLALEWNRSRCADPTSKPDDDCSMCRAELSEELGAAMLEGDASFFRMLFSGHVLESEGFAVAPNEDGGILLMRVKSAHAENPGDCCISAVPPVLGGGYSLFIAIDEDREVVEELTSLDDVVESYFTHKALIDKLAKS